MPLNKTVDQSIFDYNTKGQLSLTNPHDACETFCTVYVRAVGL